MMIGIWSVFKHPWWWLLGFYQRQSIPDDGLGILTISKHPWWSLLGFYLLLLHFIKTLFLLGIFCWNYWSIMMVIMVTASAMADPWRRPQWCRNATTAISREGSHFRPHPVQSMSCQSQNHESFLPSLIFSKVTFFPLSIHKSEVTRIKQQKVELDIYLMWEIKDLWKLYIIMEALWVILYMFCRNNEIVCIFQE